MLTDYFTLFAIARDLNRTLRTTVLAEAFTQEKNQLMLHFRASGPSEVPEQQEHWLAVSCEPSRNFVLLRHSFSRARRNTLDVLTSAAGLGLTEVRMHDSDRELFLFFLQERILRIQMFRSSANVLLTNEEGTILDAFLHPKKLVGTQVALRSRSAAPVPSSEDEFQARLCGGADLQLKTALKSLYPFLGPVILAELFFRTDLSPAQIASQLPQEQAVILYRALEELLQELRERPSPRIYELEDGSVVFALIPLRRLAASPCETFSSVHEAVRAYLSRSAQDQHFLRERKRLLEHVEKEVHRIESALAKTAVEEATLAQAGEYETHAVLLSTHLAEIPRHATSVTLPDHRVTPPVNVTIRLDPRQTPAQNADQFFRRAKKARAALEEIEHRRRELIEEERVARTLLQQLRETESEAELDELRSLHPRLLPKGSKRSTDKHAAAPSLFRVFRVAGGFEVWAGKSSENNDLLTTKHARPNDWWFHARGSSGSHVILRVGTGKGTPGRQALEEAAAIAAYYSKMKHARNVPVVMTLRKYVRKPKGAPPGTVVVEREKLLFVQPGLPGPHEGGDLRKTKPSRIMEED